VLRLPEPALARSGALPPGAGWRFEPKLDGFRCLACTHGGTFRARSRRGWMMSELLPELAAALPADVQLDGELVAYDADGRPDFHRLSARMLHGVTSIAVTYVVFDVLAVEGLAATSQPCADRRALLEALDLERPGVQLVPTFNDGAALFDAIVELELEGVVAKRERDPYRPGERLWVKTKNRSAPRFEEERAGIGRRAAARA
jgi:bifunctional non-homologous end joining protein LigD